MRDTLTLPSVRQSSLKPSITSFDCSDECTLEHYDEVSRLVNAGEDDLDEAIFSPRWLESCWPFEEPEYSIPEGSVFAEAPDHHVLT